MNSFFRASGRIKPSRVNLCARSKPTFDRQRSSATVLASNCTSTRIGFRRGLSSGSSGSGPSSSRRESPSLPPYVLYGFLLPVTGVTVASVYAYQTCIDEAPFTKRRRWLATDPAWERRQGEEECRAILLRYRGDILPRDHRASVTVERVGKRIAAAAKVFNETHIFPPEKRSNSEGYVYTVVRSEEANAFVLPGNHVFVLTGLFRYAKDEDELASILGHEVAHNLARHAGERISGGILMGIIASLTLLLDPTGALLSIFLPARALLFELPNSREHETEADRIGLVLASEACYDPRAAKRVFGRMRDAAAAAARDGGGSNPPEFASTHPAYETRMSNFDEWMPEALARFDGNDGGSRCREIREEMKRARILAVDVAAKRERQQRRLQNQQ